ncbi:tRNA/rRNA methyltransferase [Polynucleobacter meluiroseus]|uniref:tRNA (cytidine/uridine-2'-O-)-methyltransferase TrmJ n=1 Tax=Polynucleobacter meluiroseus TaxID=1938814 RepID=A0A240E2G0_9BURK|nr:RNA methyltransferase [Polynucleobacter meluiroseus]SNX28666.1 tRNA/rRNA methyltransferase [Polynucleobacter meluiroseus]
MNLAQAKLIQWVLVETSHPGNVGSTARALKTMGFSELQLVNPKIAGVAQDPEAIALASGAQDLLAGAQEHPTLSSVVKNCTVVLGLTSREREFGPPALDWSSARQLILDAVKQNQQVALLFGPERTGLENEHLTMCTHRVWLDANPDYASLNLAQAVMVCAFTLRETLIQANTAFEKPAKVFVDHADYADPAAVTAMLEHLREGLEAIDYLDPANPKKLMTRLQALFARSRLHKEEIDLLRGIAKQMILRK